MVVLCFAVLGFAQDNTKGEIFGGYQFMSIDSGGIGDRVNANGWDIDVAGFLTKNFGIAGDFGGVYKNGAHVYTFMGGPRFQASSGKVSPFVEALFGGAKAGASGVTGSTNFAFAFGGGIDVHATDRIAIRIIRFDYVGVRDSGTTFNNFRITPGIVLKF